MNIEISYRKRALVFKAFGHPVRLMIVERLLERELCVGEVEKKLDVSQANVSQHLLILRQAGIVDYRREGKKRCYFVVCPGVAEELFKCMKRSVK